MKAVINSTTDLIIRMEAFYEALEQDVQISSTHISVYFALLYQWTACKCISPFEIKRATIMQVAKISSRQTFNKCMRQLHDSGYIKYIPSYNPEISSMVSLIQ